MGRDDDLAVGVPRDPDPFSSEKRPNHHVAVKRRPPPDPEAAVEVLPELDDGETLTPEEALVKITN